MIKNFSSFQKKVLCLALAGAAAFGAYFYGRIDRPTYNAKAEFIVDPEFGRQLRSLLNSQAGFVALIARNMQLPESSTHTLNHKKLTVLSKNGKLMISYPFHNPVLAEAFLADLRGNLEEVAKEFFVGPQNRNVRDLQLFLRFLQMKNSEKKQFALMYDESFALVCKSTDKAGSNYVAQIVSKEHNVKPIIERLGATIKQLQSEKQLIPISSAVIKTRYPISAAQLGYLVFCVVFVGVSLMLTWIMPSRDSK